MMRLRSLVGFVLGNGLAIQNRMDTTMNNDASWTCHRSFDRALLQSDFAVDSSRMTLVRSWCDYCISIESGPLMRSLQRCLCGTETFTTFEKQYGNVYYVRKKKSIPLKTSV